MEPKFQSSFIPKGPIATSSSIARVQTGQKSILGFIATIIFVMAIIAAALVFGYNKYLSYQIGQMGSDLEAARANIEPEAIQELVRLDGRINSTNALLSKHTTLTPLLELLEDYTVSSLRFTSFTLLPTDDGLRLSMEGEARNYSTIAQQEEVFSSRTLLKDQNFSELALDDVGNVTFTFTAIIDPSLISYQRSIESSPLPPAVSTTSPVSAGASATSSSRSTATSTPSTSSTGSGQATPR